MRKILEKLNYSSSHVLGMINISFPYDDSIKDFFNEFQENEYVKQRAITFLREQYIWRQVISPSAFSMSVCGWQILPGYRIHLIFAVDVEKPFSATASINIGDLPIFNDTPEDIKNKINNASPYIKQKFRERDVGKISREYQEEFDEIVGYYFDLFQSGKMGDGYFINKFIKENTREKDNLKIVFIENYQREVKNINKLKEFIKLQIEKKYVAWQQDQSMEYVIQEIQSFKNLDFKRKTENGSYIDLGLCSVAQRAQHTVSQLSC